jgi:glycosyltransferase involved in cell wall biosynthesis
MSNRQAIMISFIVPAHNEELWIGRCLDSIHESMKGIARPYEVIVVDDGSTDATAQTALQSARVIHVEFRKISAVRNAGARAACGETLLFVDADTRANARIVCAALDAIHAGCAGGGCVPELDGPVPFWGWIIHRLAVCGGRVFRIVGGCFLFCTREAYLATGGFSEELHAGEDLQFVAALKKIGRFVIPGEPVRTSARKLDVAGPFQVMALLLRICVRGHRYDSPWVRDILYGQRAQQCRRPENVA